MSKTRSSDAMARFGEQNGRAKLTDAEVELIRELAGSEPTEGTEKFWTRKMLAHKFEVSLSAIDKIVKGARRP